MGAVSLRGCPLGNQLSARKELSYGIREGEGEGEGESRL